MFKKIFNKQKKESFDNKNVLVAALLIHAAKMDENYTDIEKKIIKKTLFDLGINKEKLEEILKKAENAEKDSNQILEFTREIKNTDENFKIKIVETLWNIIYILKLPLF